MPIQSRHVRQCQNGSAPSGLRRVPAVGRFSCGFPSNRQPFDAPIGHRFCRETVGTHGMYCVNGPAEPVTCRAYTGVELLRRLQRRHDMACGPTFMDMYHIMYMLAEHDMKHPQTVTLQTACRLERSFETVSLENGSPWNSSSIEFPSSGMSPRYAVPGWLTEGRLGKGWIW